MHRSPLCLALLALVLLALVWPAAAAAEDPPFVGWTALLPGLSLPYDVTSPDDCIAGRVQCVDKIVREMTRRFEPLASSCDHDAIFALTYLRVTEEYRRTVESATFFDDTSFVNHEDVVFASYYFAAYDAWEDGRDGRRPAGVANRVRRGERSGRFRERQSAPRHQRARPARPPVRSSTASGSSSRKAPAGNRITIA